MARTLRSGAGWAGEGTGTVDATWDGDVLVMTEAGTWAADGGRPMRWRASSRWWVEGAALAVEILRQDVPASAVLDLGVCGAWVGRAPFVCAPDRYAVSLRLGPEAVEVTWTVEGPSKADRVVSRYR
ncbi:DUF6314 family protein [Rubrivirga sp. SAORIC476]|uniref:DUF6314 family protein n=1 Tax=Rubrivirga sp. SAORIC476 TaxID=1961794 RepID=UPI00117A0043|nr:DUF6314 family protein [Rubrivirga sp. SAORIC476]